MASSRISTSRLFFTEDVASGFRAYEMTVDGEPKFCFQLKGGSVIQLSQEEAGSLMQALTYYELSKSTK